MKALSPLFFIFFLGLGIANACNLPLNGLSRKHFAKIMGVDPQTVVGWENGRGKKSKKAKVERLLAHCDFNLSIISDNIIK
ncbi:helix-turn-helix transcriptional regulator [Sphingobacterium sp. InxBP1]|uniref:helix-turn-helix domain-containing protein n=1 Tax=Sphingobacterium sp. InxBP1 TaxID=2870328 RepID=UPI002244BC98|nr:helix-turn-helix transcriptional regulator [Sphingobacterium sp. InxBP1]MCW8312542.1 helix-turn-helix transcriptional regulator [Sphingobacterium sp. InxBP1]